MWFPNSLDPLCWLEGSTLWLPWTSGLPEAYHVSLSLGLTSGAV